jgi:hypothetical protein
MAQLLWITRDEWMELPKPQCLDQIPKDIVMHVPLDEIRARIASPAPRFTPTEDGDFPGPVERWYGSFSGRGFTLTYHYRAPETDLLIASHCETDEHSEQLSEALTVWRETSPYG